MANTPKSKPQLTRENALKILKWKNIDLNKTPLVLLGVRGYYLDTMGVKGKNDRGIMTMQPFGLHQHHS